MSVQMVPFYKVTCDGCGCNRDNAALGFTAAFPTRQAALDDWLRFGGTVDPATGATLCDRCQPQECESCNALATGTDEDGDPACPAHKWPAPDVSLSVGGVSVTSDSGSVFTPGTRLRIVDARTPNSYIGRAGVSSQRCPSALAWDWFVHIEGCAPGTPDIPFWAAELEPLS